MKSTFIRNSFVVRRCLAFSDKVLEVFRNRKTAREEADDFTYTANALNRPVTYTRENADGAQTVTPASPDSEYSETGEDTRAVLTHHRYIHRGYLQIATLDLTRTTLNDLRLITWDPTQTVAPRPLAIQKDGTWYTYGIDLPKNITEVYGLDGYIKAAYTHYAPARPAVQGTPSQVCSGLGGWLLKPHPAPYGQVTASGNATQPLQWSSELTDTDLGLVYYNYRHYNPLDGRWCGRDPIALKQRSVEYGYIQNASVSDIDYLGLIFEGLFGQNQPIPTQPPSSTQDQNQFSNDVKDNTCECCEKYIEEQRSQSRTTYDELKKKGCFAELKCVKDYDYIGARISGKRKQDSIIMLKCDNMKAARNVNALTHELQRALDACNDEIDLSDCFGSICSEIRAYRKGGYSGRPLDESLKEKLRKRVKVSVRETC